jgi:hypothetical protein
MAARNSGSKIVVVAVAAMVTFVGVGAIYAPYFADRDKLRGLHEESDAGLSEKEKREFERFMSEVRERQTTTGTANSGNSMWNRMNQSAPAEKKD